MNDLKALAAAMEAQGRQIIFCTEKSIMALQSQDKPQLLIIRTEEGWEVYAIPKRVIVTFKPLTIPRLMEKLQKLNYLSEQINFNLLK